MKTSAGIVCMTATLALAAGSATAATPTTAALSGKTFTVTSPACSGAGSLQKAIADANASPGADVISFAKGLVVDVSGCSTPGSTSTKYFVGTIQDAVTFDGNGARLQGLQSWINSGGDVNPMDTCPAQAPNIILSSTPGFLNLAANAKVTVQDLALDQMEAVARVAAGASLQLTDVTATRIRPIVHCDTPAILSDAATVSLLRNAWSQVQGWAGSPAVVATGGVLTGDNGGTLAVQDSQFQSVDDDGFIVWIGGRVDIVTTRAFDVAGMTATDATVNIVNTLWIPTSTTGTPGTRDRMFNASTSGSRWTVKASTFLYSTVDCSGASCPAPRNVGWFTTDDGNPAGFSGVIELKQTAVGAYLNSTQSAPNPSWLTGRFTADPYTWLQGDLGLSPTELAALTSQPNLLTQVPGFPAFPDAITSFAQWGTPNLSGVLVDAIPDANGANLLTNPIDGSPITKDALGNPRVDANGRRNVGAVQQSLAPFISVTEERKTSITVAWSRPLDPASGPITGYRLFYRQVGQSTWTRIDVAGAGTLSLKVTGLTPETRYEFKVVGVNQAGDGPASNIAAGRTSADAAVAYPQGKGRVGEKLDPMKAHVSGLSGPWRFSVTKGNLPKGVTLDENTGVISGTPQAKGTFPFTVTVVGAGGSADTQVTLQVVARNAPRDPHLDYPRGTGYVGKRFHRLSPHTRDVDGPLRFSLVKGKVAPGLRFSAKTGVFTGTPSKTGTFKVTVKVKGSDASATSKVTIHVKSGSNGKKTQRATTANTVQVSGSRAVVTPGRTNAGRQIRALVTCVPASAGAAGQARYCSVTGSPTGRITVVNRYGVPVRVTVRYAAPATKTYTAYRDTDTFILR